MLVCVCRGVKYQTHCERTHKFETCVLYYVVNELRLFRISRGAIHVIVGAVSNGFYVLFQLLYIFFWGGFATVRQVVINIMGVMRSDMDL